MEWSTITEDYCFNSEQQQALISKLNREQPRKSN